MKRARRVLLLLGTVLAGCGTANDNSQATQQATAERNDINSCYAAVLHTPAPPPSRTLFVLVDQTTGLDDRLRGTVIDNVQRLLEPGTRFSIASFSANTGTNFATVLSEGNIEVPIPHERKGGFNPKKFAELNQCVEMQRRFAVEQVAIPKLREATTASTTSFSNSEILASLTQLSHAVSATPDSDKLVILVSDLIEHSPDNSFYAKQSLRTIDPETELTKAGAAHHIASFGGARIAIVGAGLISPTPGTPSRPRDPKALSALRTFWENWFQRSGARIVEYGEPDLVTALSWSSPPPSAPAS